jgi:hypothetical protein
LGGGVLFKHAAELSPTTQNDLFCEIRQERNSAVRGVAERAAKEKAVCFYTRLFYEATSPDTGKKRNAD